MELGHRPAGFAVIRTPLLPLADWAMASPANGRREAIAAWLDDPRAAAALELSSPSLMARVRQVRAAGDPLPRDLLEPLSRYFSRMCGRPAPFGLMGAVTFVGLGDEGALDEVGGCIERHSRLDMGLLDAFCVEVSARNALSVRYHPSTSIEHLERTVRYVAVTRAPSGKRRHQMVEVARDEFIGTALEAAHGGETLDGIAEHLAAAPFGLSLKDARAFVEELANEGLLVSEVSPPLTSADPARDVLALMAARGLPETRDLKKVLDAIDVVDQRSLDQAREATANANALAQGLLSSSAATKSDWLQSDLVRPSTGTVSHSLCREILEGVECLRDLGAAREDSLAGFRAAFAERYEGAAVPLCEALDPERGLRFGVAAPSTALFGLDLRRRSTPTETFDRQTAYLLAKVQQLTFAKERRWSLDPRDREALSRPGGLPLPPRFEVKVQLVHSSESGEVASAPRCVFNGTGGISGALIGRFLHLGGEHRCAAVAYAQEADTDDVIYAQIVHAPQARAGNIIARVPVGTHEIVYLGKSHRDPRFEIHVEDLTVQLRGGEFILRSRRLGKRVVPRLASAHAFRHDSNLPLYRFLCEVARQGVSLVLEFPWGPLRAAPWLPRVTLGRHVLSPERFRLDRTRGGIHEQLHRMEGHSPPRFCSLVTEGAELPIDLADRISVAAVERELRRNGVAHLVESPYLSNIESGDTPSGYATDLVVPFVATGGETGVAADGLPADAVAVAAPPDRDQRQRTERCVPPRAVYPSDDWGFLKLYGGEVATERAAIALAQRLEQLESERGASGSFFLRYDDPDRHIRLRFPAREPLSVVGELVNLARNIDGIYRVAIDTYVREVERYGGADAILHCEQIFLHDSAAVLQFLTHRQLAEDPERRMELAIAGVDRLLDDFGFAVADKLACIEPVRDALLRDRADLTALRRGLGLQYRERGERLRGLLGHPPEAASDEQRLACEPLARRSAGNEAPMDALRDLEQRSALTVPRRSIARSLCHMHVNRVFRQTPVHHELVVYDHLVRHYRGHLARRAAKASR